MRRPAKIALWSLGTLALLLLLIVGALMIGGHTQVGRQAIEALTRRLTGGMVQMTGLAGDLPARLSVEHLTLTDDRGVWLSADDVSVQWSPAALIERRVSIQSLRAASVSMARLPHSSSKPSAEPSIPRIDIDSAVIDRAVLGEALAGVPATLSLHGAARMRTLRDMQFDLTAQRLDGGGNYDVHLRFDAKHMQMVARLSEPAQGPLQNMLALPELGDLKVDLNFDGPRTAEKLQLAVQAGSLSGSAQGTLNLAELTADLNFEFASAAMRPRADLGWSHMAARGHWSGSIKSPNATAHLEVKALQTPGAIRVASLDADLSGGDGTESVRGEASGLEIPGPRPSLLYSDPVRLTATLSYTQATRPLQFAIDHRLLALHGRWLTAGKQSATWQLHLPDLAPFLSLVGQRAGGSADVQGQLDAAAAARMR